MLVLALGVGLGGEMVTPTITSSLTTKEQLTEDISGTSDFFGTGSHSISISYNETEYQEMIREFQDSGEKNTIKANVTIDGTEISEVGLRLKGNSTLMSLQGEQQQGGQGGGGQQGGQPGGEQQQGGQPSGEQEGEQQGSSGSTIENASFEEAAGGGGPGGGGQTQLSFDEAQNLPWLLIFDEYQEGRAYEGNTELSIRPATSGSSTAVNEALALSLTSASGQASQDYSVASVSVNGGAATSRIVVDIPDGQWANELGNGVLYKARAGGSMEYLGDDPTDYEDAYKQINAVGTYDMQPVMKLLDFVNNSSDEDFAAKLEDYVDVDSFAEYLATQEILSNSDAMDGPGNNYYLWYDTDTEKFSVLSWDLNLAFGGMGGGVGGGQNMPDMGDGDMPDMGTTPNTESDGETAQNGEMPTMPDMGDGEIPDMGSMENAPGGGAGRGSGVLKERFLADANFAKLYEDAYSRLYEQLISSGVAQDTLDDIVATAAEAGDSGAETLGESISSKLSQVSATVSATESSASTGQFGGSAGRTAGGPPGAKRS